MKNALIKLASKKIQKIAFIGISHQSYAQIEPLLSQKFRVRILNFFRYQTKDQRYYHKKSIGSETTKNVVGNTTTEEEGEEEIDDEEDNNSISNTGKN